MMTDASGMVEIAGWPVRMRIPPGDGPHPVLLMLHGWTGDENSMWVFASRLPARALLIAPRAPFPAMPRGYSWRPEADSHTGWPSIDDLRPAVEALVDWLVPAHFPQADLSRLFVMGFSQGAALTYALALLHPQRVAAFAGLAGFMPAGAENILTPQHFSQQAVFISHGTQDEIVPVERARRAAAQLERADAQVAYCEEAVGHKLAADCFRGLGAFFSRWIQVR